MGWQEPQWTEDEFLVLLRNLEKSDEELARMLGRSGRAVGTVRAGLVDYKNGKTQTTLLSNFMRDLLRGREHYLQRLPSSRP